MEKSINWFSSPLPVSTMVTFHVEVRSATVIEIQGRRYLQSFDRSTLAQRMLTFASEEVIGFIDKHTSTAL
jgi:hypothetical protein